MKNKKDVYQFRLTPDQKQKLSILSGYYGCSSAELIRIMIDTFYALHEKLVKKCVDKPVFKE